MKALREPISGAPGHVIEFLQAENEQKVNEFKPIYLGKYQN